MNVGLSHEETRHAGITKRLLADLRMRRDRQEPFILTPRISIKNLWLSSRIACCLLSLASIILLSSCNQNRATNQSGQVFTDELGHEVKLGKVPERIISLAPSLTETLFALGLGDRVVGVTTYCDYPPEAAEKEKVGDTLKPSLERIIALKPDLVIVSTSSQLEDYVQRIEAAGIAIYISNPRNVEESLKSIERIGDITGAQSQARALVAQLRRRVEAVTARVSTLVHPRVLIILGGEPLITVGGKSFINNLIEMSGGRSVSAGEEADYPQYSLETAIARQPEIIFLQAGGGQLPERLKSTPAALNGRVYTLDDALILRPGPRIVDGLEVMASKIHP